MDSAGAGSSTSATRSDVIPEDTAYESERSSDDDSGDELQEPDKTTDDSATVMPRDAISIPIYLKIPSASEQLSIAYFPMNTANQSPGEKISTVTRNSVDGRIRCEIKDSIIQGREETTEGIPVDYHMTWESSNVPANTFRDDYFAVKQNGMIFLTPAQTVHMRAVVEPKGTRQSESQRIGIVVHSNSREAQIAAGLATAGKWMPYEIEKVPPNQPYRIDETQIRHAAPFCVEKSANLQSVISLALGLKSSNPSPAVTLASDGLKRPVLGSDNLESLFKKQRVHRMADLQQQTGKTVEETVRALTGCAYLVQGVWAGSGSLYFARPSANAKLLLPFSMSYDYLLSCFANDQTVDMTAAKRFLQLSDTHANSLLNMMAAHVSGSRWRFAEETDTAFLQSYPEIVKEQETAWEERRLRIERTMDEMDRERKTAPVVSPKRADVPVKKRVAPNSAPPAKRVAEEVQALRDDDFKRPAANGSGFRGARSGRGRGRGRGRQR